MANLPFKSLHFLIQKRFLSTSEAVFTSPSPHTSSFTVQYLTKSCGLPLETAISASRKLQIDEKSSKKHESIVVFLKSHGFSDTQIGKLITKRPNILQSRLDKNMKPKIQYLISNGLVGSILTEIIVSNPVILRRNLISHIRPSFDFLKTVIESEEKVVAAVRRSSWLLTFDLKTTMRPNVDFLISEGVPMGRISKMIVSQPRVILQKVDKVASAVKAVKELGLEPTAPMFIHAIRAMVSLSDSTWKRKFELFKSLGWSEEEIISAFKRAPLILSCSEEKIKNAMNFYVNTMKLEPEVIIAYPKFLMYAIDKRMRPRYNLLKFLEVRGLLEWNKKLAWVLLQPERLFLENYNDAGTLAYLTPRRFVATT
ncbi:transcription termination factor MTERF5, chloroplastic-like [Malania oleifera]|uniref:transcription termination factor MTERF5, chloroplastic-like n=1 Tax=Malania oleifera TaxID=397392 RepID=UPI0025ADD686|nr:transcription termination factor MTERF5, chloroplastic-like [Malania oleifera]